MKPAVESDRRRLWSALAASLFINALLWRAVGGTIMGQKSPTPTVIEISRVVLTKEGKKIPKTVNAKQIRKKVENIRRRIVRRPAPPPIRERPRLARPIQPSPVKPQPRAPEAAQAVKPVSHPARPQPEGAHHRTLTAQNPVAPDAGNVKAGGNAGLGQPPDNQNYGEAKTNPARYATPVPQPQPTEPPAPPPTPIPPPVPTATPRPEPTATPKPEPTATSRPEPTATPRPAPTPKPEPTSTPRPKGATRDAEAVRTVQPEIPDELKGGDFKSSVRVRVEVSADGSPDPSLRSSSGNAEIDSRVLAALRKWRWKPALKDGESVASTQYFRFDFEVR